MNNKEILTKAIEKAVENGWVWYKADDVGVIMSSFTNIEDDLCREMFYEVIFSHDFAKAFFRFKPDVVDMALVEDKLERVDWAWHLQQMVLEESPLLYLEKFI